MQSAGTKMWSGQGATDSRRDNNFSAGEIYNDFGDDHNQGHSYTTGSGSNDYGSRNNKTKTPHRSARSSHKQKQDDDWNDRLIA